MIFFQDSLKSKLTTSITNHTGYLRYGSQRKERLAIKRKLEAEAVPTQAEAVPAPDQVEIEENEVDPQEDLDAGVLAAAEMQRRRDIVDEEDIELEEIIERIPEFLDIQTVIFSRNNQFRN